MLNRTRSAVLDVALGTLTLSSHTQAASSLDSDCMSNLPGIVPDLRTLATNGIESNPLPADRTRNFRPGHVIELN